MAPDPDAAKALVQGLQGLRADGLLCDAILQVGKGRVPAHRVVLAALSAPLRARLAPGPPARPEGEPEEILVKDAKNPEALLHLVEHIYGLEKSLDTKVKNEVRRLCTTFGFPPPEASTGPSLAKALGSLRKANFLCDVVLAAGGTEFPAHRCVLAGLGGPLRRYILRDPSDLFGDIEPQPANEPLQLALACVSHPEAVEALLRHAYGETGCDERFWPADEAAGRDLATLAFSLQVPELCAAAQRRGLAAPAAPAKALSAPSAAGGKAATRGRPKASSKKRPAEEEEGLEEGVQTVPSVADEPKASASPRGPSAPSSPELFVRSMRFADREVPSQAANVQEVARTRQEQKALERIRELFEWRPVWLEAPMQRQLPGSLDATTVQRLLGAVAYQCADGPWQKAYVRLGWDPRRTAEGALQLQVLDFRDPFFRQAAGKQAASEAAERDDLAIDWQFKRAPVLKTQEYQLDDIEDDFVRELVQGADPLQQCDKRTGWLPQIVLDAVRDRLIWKSQQLREKEANSKARAAARSNAAAAPAGRKRARVGGS